MPELPEVERLRLSLLPHLCDAEVLSARLKRRDFCTTFANEKGRRPAPIPEMLLKGAEVRGLVRKGKQLAVVAKDGRTLLIHLGMSGQVLFVSGAQTPRAKHQHVEWRIRRADGVEGALVFRDPRRFGGVWTYPSFEQLEAAAWSALGPDGYTSPLDELREAIGRVCQSGERPSSRAIKPTLLDQAVVAGVGNIYADESLFRVAIKPQRRCCDVLPEEVDRLAREVRRVLTEAVAGGGSTLRDYVDANGEAGSAQVGHRVYGRGGEPCVVCGAVLVKSVLGQRTTVHCGVCQR